MPGLAYETSFTVTLIDVNQAPTDLSLSRTSVAENQPIGTAVGTLSTTDPDPGDTFTYQLVSGAGDTGNASFTIVGNQLRTAAVLDFETQHSYSVRISTTTMEASPSRGPSPSPSPTSTRRRRTSPCRTPS